MTVKQVIDSIYEVMRCTNTERTRLAIPTSLRPISVYGPIVAVRKSGDSFPFQVCVQEGPDEYYWVNLGEMPDWKEVLCGVYRAAMYVKKKKEAVNK